MLIKRNTCTNVVLTIIKRKFKVTGQIAHLPVILDTGIKLVSEGDSNRLVQTMIDG